MLVLLSYILIGLLVDKGVKTSYDDVFLDALKHLMCIFLWPVLFAAALICIVIEKIVNVNK